MALHYGHSELVIPTQPRLLNYAISYNGIKSSGNTYPYSTGSGFPSGVMYCKNVTENTKFMLLTHTFDADNNITGGIKIRYKIRVSKMDGTRKDVVLTDVDLDIKWMGGTGTQLYIGVLDKEFKFSDIFSDYDKLLTFIIYFEKISSGSPGNESVLNIAVQYEK